MKSFSLFVFVFVVVDLSFRLVVNLFYLNIFYFYTAIF